MDIKTKWKNFLKYPNIFSHFQSFVVFIALFAAANAAHSHATVSHGHSGGFSHAVAHAPGFHAAPVYKVAPAYHAAPVYKVAPAYHAAAAYHAPIYHAAKAYHAPIYHAAPAYHAPTYKKPVYADVEAKYQYGYGADDNVSGVHIAASESRDGYSTSGEYRVALPDCRTQIVKYNTADGYSGNVVEVTYEGTPCEAKAPAYFAPAPAYKAAPAPSYKAA